MVNVVTGLSRYAMALLMAFYTLSGFQMVQKQEEEKMRDSKVVEKFTIFASKLGN